MPVKKENFSHAA